jgi:predicted nucleic acid-binding protein
VTGWLLDTNILSELRRPKPERKVLAFIAAHPLEHLYVSAVTFAEIRFGIELVADASKRAELNDWLAHKVRPMFEERVLPVTEDVTFKWRLLVEEGRGDGALPRTDRPLLRYERLRTRQCAGRQSAAVMFAPGS